jgi:hypothetical protein
MRSVIFLPQSFCHPAWVRLGRAGSSVVLNHRRNSTNSQPEIRAGRANSPRGNLWGGRQAAAATDHHLDSLAGETKGQVGSWHLARGNMR